MPSKQDALLASIRQQAPTHAAVIDEPQSSKAPTGPARRKVGSRPVSAAKGSRVGAASPIWLHDEDRRLVRELAAWLAGQGLRTSDSLIFRAAIRMVRTGPELLTAYRKASELDGRKKKV